MDFFKSIINLWNSPIDIFHIRFGICMLISLFAYYEETVSNNVHMHFNSITNAAQTRYKHNSMKFLNNQLCYYYGHMYLFIRNILYDCEGWFVKHGYIIPLVMLVYWSSEILVWNLSIARCILLDYRHFLHYQTILPNASYASITYTCGKM